MEEKLFPHSRSYDSEAQMEEERRLCYVGMTRAEKRLYLSWARLRRRWGSDQPEPSLASRFLSEVPEALTKQLGKARTTPHVDLFAERHYVRESARRNLYTGKTYNSVENISQFFAERGMPAPSGIERARTPAPQPPSPPVQAPQPQPQQRPAGGAASGGAKKLGPGSIIVHPKYGRGTVMRREGDGDDAKLTVSFPGHGLKKIIEKFAGITKA
jgi:DNA helicase-2/ATP-dependent DNA helicase PcrA